MKYRLELEYLMKAHIDVEAGSLEEAELKWNEGDYVDENIVIEEELYGGIPYNLVTIKKLGEQK